MLDTGQAREPHVTTSGQAHHTSARAREEFLLRPTVILAIAAG